MRAGGSYKGVLINWRQNTDCIGIKDIHNVNISFERAPRHGAQRRV